MKELAVVILAAGKSTRMKSKMSKVFHPLAGLPVITYPVREALRLRPKKIVIVIGRGEEADFRNVLGRVPRISYCVQSESRGTADAVLRTERCLRGFDGQILVMPGDVPLLDAKALEEFIKKAERDKTDCAFMTAKPPDPSSYGRVLRDVAGRFVAIREYKDATEEERAVNEINTSIVLARARWLFSKLKRVRPHNVQREYYLTDVVELSDSVDDRVGAYCFGPYEHYLGVNTRQDLSFVNKYFYSSIAREWMSRGVGLLEPDHTYIDYNARIGEDTTIGPFSFIRGGTKIGRGCTIENGVVITDSVIGDNVHIKPYTVIENARVKSGAVVGPFSRLRPDAVLENDVKVGNFVEVKKSVLKRGVKANHLSYIGDATVGAGTNVGCGTITCNYDGKKKHRTVIGEGVFVGSDVQFVAPVKIGKGAIVGAGSTVTENVAPNALAISRSKQVNIRGYALKKRRGKK